MVCVCVCLCKGTAVVEQETQTTQEEKVHLCIFVYKCIYLCVHLCIKEYFVDSQTCTGVTVLFRLRHLCS